MINQPPSPPGPGWLDDPTDRSLLRWWDGRQWTAYTSVKPSRRRLWGAVALVVGAWAVALGTLAVAITGARTEETSTTTTAPPINTTTTASSTTTSTTTTTTAPAETIDPETPAEVAMIAMASANVNEQIGTAYARDRAGTLAALGGIADNICDLVRQADGDEQVFNLGMLGAWWQLDPESQEFYGGSPETWGSLAGALLFWRCPDDYEALRG
jgi:hypothetical protein